MKDIKYEPTGEEPRGNADDNVDTVFTILDDDFENFLEFNKLLESELDASFVDICINHLKSFGEKAEIMDLIHEGVISCLTSVLHKNPYLLSMYKTRFLDEDTNSHGFSGISTAIDCAKELYLNRSLGLKKEHFTGSYIYSKNDEIREGQTWCRGEEVAIAIIRNTKRLMREAKLQDLFDKITHDPLRIVNLPEVLLRVIEH
ncbi:MAG: hypothetical protein Q9M91_00215 [Candidatus Dojkabacteria bacterium]|nr:hypothetical protein [Candidatus Dojkabacteria bacterium]MDQ7020256.1 hypothetical protein [Candidatus Dojkabacteria bacterium]